MGLIDKLKKDKKLADFAYKNNEAEQEFISTGVLSLNLLFSGRLDGGIPKGKINMIAADSSLGKSFTAMKVIKNAQKKGMEVILVDSEFSYDLSFAENIGIDQDKIFVYQNNQIEDIQKFIMGTFNEMTKEERGNVLLVIDSWNAVVTSKTVNDATSGKDVSDMTISKKKNTLARLLTGLHTTGYIVNQIYACVTGETLVKTPTGNIAIKDINVGDEVHTYDGVEKIKNKFEYDNSIVYDVELDNGDIVTCSEDHKFYVKMKSESGDMIYTWVETSNLIPEMEILEHETRGIDIDI